MFDTIGQAVAAYRAANEAEAPLVIRRDWEAWTTLHQQRRAVTDYLHVRGREDLLFPLAMEQVNVGRPEKLTLWAARTDALLAERDRPTTTDVTAGVDPDRLPPE